MSPVHSGQWLAIGDNPCKLENVYVQQIQPPGYGANLRDSLRGDWPGRDARWSADARIAFR
jgi:hypothetical protein